MISMFTTPNVHS